MKKNNFAKEIFFLFIGLLLLIALIICVYLVSLDRKYIETNATVVDVVKDGDKNKITFNYTVSGDTYEYVVTRSEDLKIGSKFKLYYMEDNVNKAKLSKTNKLIFVCPLIGLVLCTIGVLEMVKKRRMDNNEEEEYKTKVISVLGETQRLKIITDGQTPLDYSKSLEETIEVPVKSIMKRNNKIEVLDKQEEVFEKPIRKNDKKIVGERKVIPNYYYVSNGALVYEEFGKEMLEIDFKDIEKVIKTVNRHGKVVKLVVIANKCHYVLTNMGKCDIEVTSNLLYNKLLAVDESFNFEVENKEY